MVAGQFSNADHAKTMGLPKKKLSYYISCSKVPIKIARTYGLDPDQRGKLKWQVIIPI